MTLPSQLDQLIQQITATAKKFHALGMYAPHAGVIDVQGKFQGDALTSDGIKQITVPQTLAHFESKFRELANSRRIVASAVLYHGPGVVVNESRASFPPAETTDDCKAMITLLEHADGTSVYLVIPYEGEGADIAYANGKLIEKPRSMFPTPVGISRPWWRFWE